MQTLESKDPDGVNVNYKIDLSKYLQGTETVVEVVSVIISDPGLVLGGSQIVDSGTGIVVFLSGGTLGSLTTVTVRFKVSGSPQRTDDRSFRIMVEEL